jgi:signal transduction histidine kinase
VLHPKNDRTRPQADTHRLLAYVADLELEVDQLRKQGGFIHHQIGAGLKRILELCSAADGDEFRPQVIETAQGMAGVLRALHEPPGYHPAHDQVVAIAVRPLVERVFQRQRLLTGHSEVVLRLELEIDHVEWFPVRLRHILDNLFSNALRYRDPVKNEAWVLLSLRAVESGYEFRVSDNGMGMPADSGGQAFELLSRAAPLRESGLGVGLPVVRLLVDQSGGSLVVSSEEGRGTDFVLTLPRYDIDDYLTRDVQKSGQSGDEP